MNKLFSVILAALLLSLSACSRTDEPAAGKARGAGGGHVTSPEKTEAPKGPHNGRLLADGNSQIEVTIFEKGVPPEFRVYAYQNGEPVDPAAVKVSIELTRLGGRVDRFAFTPQADYLRGDAEVVEPHSFDVKVQAEHAGQSHVWTYDSYEGRTTIAAEMAKTAGVATAVAGAGVLREQISLYGSIQPNAERERNVTARFPGVIRSVVRKVGDAVGAGGTLATVESNESLQTYAVTAPIAGVVTQRMANPGESAGSEPLFVISDFSTVWAELSVFPRDRARLRQGQNVTVTANDGVQTDSGQITYIAPVGSGNQSWTARAVLRNADRQWTPGLFVTGTVTVGESPLSLMVKNSALQTFRDWTVVFINVGDAYEARPLELGRTDGAMTEVLGGLAAGDRYVTENSYLIKADIEKSGASHDH